MKDANSTASIDGRKKTTISKKAHSSTSHRRVLENFLVVWLDDSISTSHADCRSGVEQLRRIANDVNLFTDLDNCVAFLADVRMQTAYVVVLQSLAQTLVPLIHWMPSLGAIYIWSDNCHQDEEWTRAWSKIEGVFNRLEPICEALKLAVKRCDQDSIPISFAQSNRDVHSNLNPDQLESSFMYTQLFKTTLLSIEHTESELQQMVDYCQKIYATDPSRLKLANEFGRNYHADKVIWWYTREGFIYETLNHALRLLEADIVVNMGFFIHDLHRRIEHLHRAQVQGYGGTPFTVYRGQRLTVAGFERLRKNEGGLMSFNGFLSTSSNQRVSLMYADVPNTAKDMVGILFVIVVDPNSTHAPFANIQRESRFEHEEEILFTMHTVFRIVCVRHSDDVKNLFEVQMTLTTDDDTQLRALTERYIEELQYSTGWHRLGRLLLLVESVDKAEELYNVLLEKSSNDKDTAFCNHQLGAIKSRKGDYTEAVAFYEKSLVVWEKTLPENYPNLTVCYNSIGSAYDDMGEQSKALFFYEKALEILLAHFPENHPELASSYNDIASVYESTGEYQKALSFHEKSLEIKQRALPSNHPNLALSYNNIGSLYQDIGKCAEALAAYEKARDIQEVILPANHPDLAISYNNVGSMYHEMEDNLKAMYFFQKALDIWRKTLPEDHPSLAALYGNIGAVYRNMEDYSKSLWFNEKALSIVQTRVPVNHAKLAVCYNNIGGVCESMKDFPKALSFYEKALDVWQKVLPANHPVIATSYNNVAGIYCSMKAYSTALSYYEKATEMRETHIPVSHADLAVLYNNIALVYNHMGEYSKSLSFYATALDMWQATPFESHSWLATVYRNTALAYTNLGEYSNALPLFEKALAIYEKSLPERSVTLANIYRDIAMVYTNMEQHLNALPFYEKAVDIHEKTVPAHHLALGDLYSRISFAYNEKSEYSKAKSFAVKSMSMYFKYAGLQTVRLSTMFMKITQF